MNYKKDFVWFTNNPDKCYLDSAATALKPKTVTDSILKYYDLQSTNSHSADSLFAHQTHVEISKTRQKLAELINCDYEEILFSSGATESLNLVAQSIRHEIKTGDEIVLTKLEHGSNLLPWYRLRDELGAKIIFTDTPTDSLTPEMFVQKLTPNTRVVSFTGASNLLGTLYDVQAIIDAIKQYNPNIYVCVDCAQRLGHRPCDMKKWNVDFAAFSGHKMYGPTGIGATFIKKELQAKITPLRFGGGMNFNITDNDFSYMESVDKFEGGTPHIAGIYGWGAAIDYINSIGYEKIIKHELEIRNYLNQNFKDIENIIVYNKTSNSATIVFNYKGIFPQDLASFLGTKNIIVRGGLSCAKLLNQIIDAPVGVVRASFGLYNTIEDAKLLVETLKKFRKEDILNEII